MKETEMIALLEHPWLLTLLLIGALSALGMTYEFILRLFGKKGLVSDEPEEEENSGEEKPFELPPNKGDTDKYIYSEKKGNY